MAAIPGFGIDRVAAAAGSDPDVLRLENLDTDLPPPPEVIIATREAAGSDDANSYLPFTGDLALREAVAGRLRSQTGRSYDPETEVVITCGGTEGILDTLFALADPGDEVILSDPTYAGMTNRVRLVGAVPRLVPYIAIDGEWRLDLDALARTVTPRTRALFLMSPSMPSGAVLNQEEWQAVARTCRDADCPLIYNAAMERILFRNRRAFHPATLDGMAERTITIGSVSKEFRMIGWRVGWVVGPADVIRDVARAHIYNTVTPSGIAQAGARIALSTDAADVRRCVDEWEQRHDFVVEQLRAFPVMPAGGGWSLLLDVGALGYDSHAASRLLLERGKVAATPMRDWGERNGDRFVRLVFSNEPRARLRDLRQRVDRALTRS